MVGSTWSARQDVHAWNSDFSAYLRVAIGALHLVNSVLTCELFNLFLYRIYRKKLYTAFSLRVYEYVGALCRRTAVPGWQPSNIELSRAEQG